MEIIASKMNPSPSFVTFNVFNCSKKWGGKTKLPLKGNNERVYGRGCVHLWWFVLFSAGVSDEEDQKPVRLPLKVAVELQPRSNHSWARVQSLAHNPRLR